MHFIGSIWGTKVLPRILWHFPRRRNVQWLRRQRKRRLKIEFAFFQSLSRLFLPAYFVKCRRTLLKLNFKGPYPISEREIEFRRCLFKISIKREIRHFHIVVVQKRQRNVQKSVMHVQSCCFAYWTYCLFVFLTFSLRSCRWILKSLFTVIHSLFW